MTYVVDVLVGHEDGDSTSRTLKSKDAAIRAGIRAQEKAGIKAYGYFAADRHEGEGFGRRHIVAEGKSNGVVLWRVWC